jgi:cell division protein FtsI (penicillin-binding protein 3)
MAQKEFCKVRPEHMQQPNSRVRWLSLTALALLWILLVLGRLAYLQLFRYGKYLAKAQKQQEHTVEINPTRGMVLDRNGNELAVSTPADFCFADPSEITNPEMVASLLAPVLGKPSAEIEARLHEGRFVRLERRLSKDAAARIVALNLRGVYVQQENHRTYPAGQLAAHVLGWVDPDEHGLGGIEYARDREIRGRPGRMLVSEDAHQKWYDRRVSEPQPGTTVVLTIDQTIQYIVEDELARGIALTHAKSGVVVVMDPNNGSVLAMSSWPTFDPNDASHASADARMNRAVTAAYEPGSTFKLITIAGALEEGITRPSEVVDCQMGKIVVAGRLIHDHKPFGLLTVAGILAQSSDVGAIKIGLRLGAPKFDQYIRLFGFGRLSGIELPGENRGLLRPLENWTPSSIGSLAMGQEISVNPVQLVAAVSAIANGGLLPRAHIVQEIRRGATVEPRAQRPPTRVLSTTTSATVREMMEGVILEGTGKKARMNGYSAGGKSGTAQKIDPSTGRYSPNQYVASFTGFAPLNTPALAILVALDSPVGPHFGGDTAGPIFRHIGERALAHLGVPHDEPFGNQEQLAGRSKGKQEASPATEEPATIEAEDEGGAAEGAPASGFVGPVQRSTRQTMAFGDGTGITVPHLVGLSVRAVAERCSRLGLTPVLVGNGMATEQVPQAGALLSRGDRVTVRFAHAARVVAVAAVGARK